MSSTTSRWLSPLRYPGGKARMAGALAEVFENQFGLLDVEVWVEPFAGGAGAGLHLLERGVVAEVWLTERNPALAAFWRAITCDHREFAARVRACQPNMGVWWAARELVAANAAGDVLDDLDLGLAALIVNRCSRSGMVNSRVGPIGGKAQSGRWHVGSRWNGEGLADRITLIGELSEHVRFIEGDGIEQIAELNGSVGIEDEMLLFVDPPYLVQGNRIYEAGMSLHDHKVLASALADCAARWLLTYDSDERILGLYPGHRVLAYEIANTANRCHVDEEYAVLSNNLAVRDDQTLLPAGATRWAQHAPHG